jgi:protein-tyrosine kinase
VGIIEQAARRLEELRRSGIDVPERSLPGAGLPAAAVRSDLPARAARAYEESPASPRPALNGNGRAGGVTRPAEPASQSEQIEIDLDRLGAMGYVTPKAPRGQIADEFRVIKRLLLANLDDKSATPMNNANLIMVTSSVPGEGKTFVAINLAISIAMEMDKRVLLVDADVARPCVMKYLGIDRTRGFLDALADPTLDMSGMLLRTNIDRLTLLPAGAPRGHATEMLASKVTNDLLAQLATRYVDRIIVFDSPPLLPSTESRVLATGVGQIVLVVEAERTPQKTVMLSLAALEACPVVLPLLNKTSRSDVGSYYGYYGPMDR